jgi:hypothetical protein
MRYPGRVIKTGEEHARVMRALKTELNKLLALQGEERIALDEDNAIFGPRVRQAVQLFQARHVDNENQPLSVDGQVGTLTWGALFGADTVPTVRDMPDGLLRKVLAKAGKAADDKVREDPMNSNRGPQVNEYLARTDVKPGNAWCCAFTYWCFDEAAKEAHKPNPMFKTAGCLKHWNNAESRGAKRIRAQDAINDPGRVKPGMVFIMDYGGGLGHTGFVEQVHGGYLHTIEGNTDASQTREGGGVYRLRRKITSVNKGFIDYAEG